MAAGLAERSVSEEDRRRAQVWITRAGKCLVARSSPPLTARLVAALETLGDAELSGLARSLEALVHSMGLDAVTATMLFDDPESNGRAPRRPPQSPGRTRSQGRRRK